MKRKMAVGIANLTEKQRERIAAAASAHGFEAYFYTSAQDIVPHAEDVEIIFTNMPDPAAHAPMLKWFCTSNAGYDRFLKEGIFASKQAVLTHSSGAYGVTIAEHIVMVTLEILRRQHDYSDIIARRAWVRNLPIRSIRGSRITILGTGDAGREAARRLNAFKPARIVGVNRQGANPEGLFDQIMTVGHLNEILPETDLLIMCLPDSAETRGLMNAERLALLPDGAVVVNVGRGSTMDQQALAAELRANRLSAALDVFEREPIPEDDPLWDCPNLLITPHTAGNLTLPYTVERVVDMFLENFEKYCAGRPLERQVCLS